jgi:hypothetical protein
MGLPPLDLNGTGNSGNSAPAPAQPSMGLPPLDFGGGAGGGAPASPAPEPEPAPAPSGGIDLSQPPSFN